MTFVFYLLVGAVGGTIAGLLGVGGGIVIVPALIAVFAYLDYPASVLTHMAVGTSLATIIPTSISSIRAHHQQGAVDWRLVTRLGLGVLVGAGLGALIADQLAGQWLQVLFGGFAVLVALQVGLGSDKNVATGIASNLALPGTLGLSGAGTNKST